MEKMDEFRGHPGGGRAGNQRGDGPGVIAGFFKQLAAGGFRQGFSGVLGFVADESGGDFDHELLDRDAELLDEDNLIFRGDGENPHASIGVRAADKIPVANAVKAKPRGFEKNLWNGHRVN